MKRWLCALLLAACARSSARSADFAIVTETAVLREGDPLPARSPIFDGNAVRLRAVRGDTLSFVVATRSPDVVPALSLPDGPLASRRYAVGMVNVREASTALFGPSRGTGSYPDRLIPGDEPALQTLFDIDVAADARAGNHRGELTFSGKRFPVEIEVIPVAIDRKRSPLVWVWYLPRELARGHGIASGKPTQELLALEKRYIDLFLAHGALLATDPSPYELETRRKLLHGSALYAPVNIRSRDPKKLAANTRAAIEFFETLPQTPFAIPIDEPRDAKTRSAVVANGKVIGTARQRKTEILHVVTDYDRGDYDGAVDIFMSPRAITEPTSASSKGRWTYNGRPPMAGALTVDAPGGSLRTWGWIAFRYKVELWHAWEGLYFTDRYNDADAPTDFANSIATFDERRAGGEDLGNGDGLLAYPELQPSLRLKILRRGLLDRLLLAKLASCGGAAKAEAIARATIPRALGDAEALALWPMAENGWERARGSVLDAIVTSCPAE